MNSCSCAVAAALSAAISVGLIAPSARADISGFTVGTYTYNQADAGSPAVVGPNSIQMTTGVGQNRSIWFNARQDVGSFTAHFTYLPHSSGGGFSSGLAFVLSNSAAGTAALGSTDVSNYSGISPSVAMLFNSTGGDSSVGFFRNGVVTNALTSVAPVDFYSATQPVNVTLNYDGNLLSVLLVEGTSTFGPQTYLVGSVGSTLGSPNAYVGFTAGTAGSLATHTLSNFTYMVPSPASFALLGMGGLTCVRRARRRS